MTNLKTDELQIAWTSGLGDTLPGGLDAYMGVSFSKTRYFSRPVMARYVEWACARFQEFLLIVADHLEIHNLRVFRNLSLEEATAYSQREATHNVNIDKYVMGVLRRDIFTIKLNFLPTDPTHDHLTGLIKASITNPVPVDGFKILFPDLVSQWVASGQLKSVNNIMLPTDGLSSADVSIRFSGLMTINGVVIGN